MRRLAQLAILLVLASTLCAASAFAQSGGLVNATRGFPVPNDGSTGTILNGTAKIQANGTAIIAGTGDTAVPVYIVNGGAGTTGNAVLAAAGTLAACVMDSNQTNAGAFHVVQSTTNTNECHAQSTAPASGAWTIGFLASSSTTAGQLANVWVGGFQFGAGGGGAVTISVPTELLINGAGQATSTNFSITKNTEAQAEAWLTPAQPGLTNVVQSAVNSCNSGTTCTVTFNSNFSRNDAMFFQFVASTPPTGLTITDSLSNTFTAIPGTTGRYYFCTSPNSGAETITFSNGTSLGVALLAVELQGVNTSSCLDQVGFSSALSATTASSIAQATELIIGGFTNIGSVGTGVATFGQGVGYTGVNQIIAPGAGRLTNFMEVLNQTTALPLTTQTATATDFGSQLSLSAVVATFKLTTTGQYIPFFQTIGMAWLPVATQTPGANDCVNWQPSAGSNSFVFGDSGLPCLGSGANGLSAGSVTLSGGAGSHTFTTAYTNAPTCVATDTTAANATKATSSTSAVTLAGTGSDVLNWVCTPAVN